MNVSEYPVCPWIGRFGLLWFSPGADERALDCEFMDLSLDAVVMRQHFAFFAKDNDAA